MEFDRLTQIAADAVGVAQRQLPPEIRALARGVPVHYERLPAADVIAEGFLTDILGLSPEEQSDLAADGVFD